jgi:hypothetical protein
MKQTQWVPATIVLVAVGILVGGAGPFRTRGRATGTNRCDSRLRHPRGRPRQVPAPPPISEPDVELHVATPRAMAIPLPVGNEAAADVTAEAVTPP